MGSELNFQPIRAWIWKLTAHVLYKTRHKYCLPQVWIEKIEVEMSLIHLLLPKRLETFSLAFLVSDEFKTTYKFCWIKLNLKFHLTIE